MQFRSRENSRAFVRGIESSNKKPKKEGWSHRVRGIRQGNDVAWLRILRQQSYRGLARSPLFSFSATFLLLGIHHLLQAGHSCTGSTPSFFLGSLTFLFSLGARLTVSPASGGRNITAGCTQRLNLGLRVETRELDVLLAISRGVRVTSCTRGTGSS